MKNNIKIIKTNEDQLLDIMRFICDQFYPEISENHPELEEISEIDFDSLVNYFQKLNNFEIPNCIYAAYDGDKIVGVSSGKIDKHPWFVSSWGRDHFWFVKKGYRKSKCGKILFNKLMKWFKEHKAERIQMSHYSWNSGLSEFYKKNGFTPYETHYVLRKGD